MRRLLFFIFAAAFSSGLLGAEERIDRKAVVSRHDPVIHQTVANSPAQVGNGKFAFGMDITGMQTFVPFNTLSDWSWHSFPLPEGVKVEDYKPVYFESHGRNIPYIDSNPECPEISEWLKCNPHRFNLGRVGMALLKKDGTLAVEADLSDCTQTTDLWDGYVTSIFSLDGVPVKVVTSCDPEKDMVEFSVSSDLLKQGRLSFFVDLPYADARQFPKQVGDYESVDRHASELGPVSGSGAVITHTMDEVKYWVKLNWMDGASIRREQGHRYSITPDRNDCFNLVCLFTENSEEKPSSRAGETLARAKDAWHRYWQEGAAVDFSGSRDSRWSELERRVVLSQYLMRVNESGLYPPQESGLVNNGWYGRFHWEMIWWHGVHFGLWNRFDCINGYLDKYGEYMPEGIRRAQSEGRNGVRWPKCTGNFNREWPCDAHAWLIWQEPHPIYFAELEYRSNPCSEVLDKWRDIVLNTADYMADYVFWDKDGRRFVLGPPLVPVSENTKYKETMNSIFEVEYFHYGLQTALKWADRLGLPKSRTKQWRRVLDRMSDLPQEDGYYITYEGMPDMWHNYNFEHPAITGIYGWLPGENVDKDVFSRTFYRILKDWKFDTVWGWDYPMMAMAAARLGDGKTAVDLLCATAHKYGFDVHGFADTWPFPYFPANGGLLTAVAMMCEGWDGSDGRAPGFPSDGSWSIKYEGFNRMQ